MLRLIISSIGCNNRRYKSSLVQQTPKNLRNNRQISAQIHPFRCNKRRILHVLSYSALIAPHSTFIAPVIRRLLHQIDTLAGYHVYPANVALRSDQSTSVRQVPPLWTS